LTKHTGANRVSTTSFTDCSPIFVVGAGRSGTTLLQLMLNAHPGIAVAGELGYFDQILQLRRLVPDLSAPEQVDRLFELLRNTYNFQYLTEVESVLPQVQRRLKADPEPSYEKFYRYFMEGYGALRTPCRFGEKTPGNIRHLDELVALFPLCKIVHLIRDPRANVASRLKLPILSNDVITNAIKWKIDALYGQNFLLSNPQHRKNYCYEKYESLVLEPETTLRRICAFIGEPYDQSMLDYYRSSEHFIKDEPWKEGTSRPVYASSLEKWRQELTESQIYLIELVTGRQLEHFGYQRTAVRLRAKVASPFQLAIELGRWGRFKLRERKARQREPATVYGTSTKLYHMLWRSLVHR
jgi:hypothetical protein